MSGFHAKPPLGRSKQESSSDQEAAESAQLSSSEGVGEDVSSVAMDRGLLAMSSAASFVAEGGNASATLTDADVMLRVKAGDESAFSFLVQKYRRAMVHFMYRMAHSPAVAEDLAQEVFLRVYRSRETYEASAKFTTWLYRIATNLAVNHIRDTRHERQGNMASLDEPDPDTGQAMDVADSKPTTEEVIIQRERLAAIRSKVEALPERQKLAVLMHKYQQMDYKQIAEVLKLSESATKSLLFRAYESLRQQLKEFV
jgi:RNA polymerase sigma-70 factor (ECF subfamily)